MKPIALIARSLTFLLPVLILVGCASVSVQDREVSTPKQPVLRPAKLYVRPFDISTAELNVDRTGDDLKKFKAGAVDAITSSVVEELSKFYPTERIASTSTVSYGNILLLEGRILKINQGSRALRIVVGFGAGGTKMETSVVLYDMAIKERTPVLAFDTTGGSGAEPGITGTDPVSAAGSAAAGAGKGVSDDTKRTARMIAYRISQYFGEQGWISADQVKEAKQLGE